MQYYKNDIWSASIIIDFNISEETIKINISFLIVNNAI